ncbi:MAG TPA: hypothetical protein VIV66_07075 [Pyrinomonadaceae bacterium]
MNQQLSEKSAIGLDGNLAAALGYPIGILGLINFIIEKQNKFVKFHGIQSVLYSVAFTILFFVIWIAMFIIGIIFSTISNALGMLVWSLFGLLAFAAFIVWIGGLLFFAYKAYQGQMFKLPFIGNMAENLANK